MDLCDPSSLKAVLSRHGLWAQKGLGQHFLCSPSAVRSILDGLQGAQGVLEIGPGPGVLTRPLSDQVEQLVAIELDSAMLGVLLETAPKAAVLQKDALTADWKAVLRNLPQPRAIVSNLPYYITAALLQKAAECAPWIDCAVFMMQREVAHKILSQPGERERGSLSVFLQGRFDIRKLADVPPGAFLPPPKVASTVLRFVPRGEAMPEHVEPWVRSGFAQPRKTLANNLQLRAGGREVVESALDKAGLDPKVRPHQLTEDQWVALASFLEG